MRETLGIVLSGGGSRGLAHVGVLRALAERNIHPSRVAGTSAGALVGALYAAGFSPAEMLEFFKTRSPFRVSNISLTKPGLLDTSRVVEDFEEYFPADSFQALRVPLSIVATDILDGSERVFEEGPLIRAILASCSFPVVFTPTEIDGRLYCDGGIVDNFPVELVEGRCDVLLGVYVNPVQPRERAELRNALTVLQRSLEVGMYQAARKKFRHCDVTICPDGLSRFNVFDTKHLEEIEELGHRAALRQIDDLEARLGGGAKKKNGSIGTDGVR